MRGHLKDVAWTVLVCAAAAALTLFLMKVTSR